MRRPAGWLSGMDEKLMHNNRNYVNRGREKRRKISKKIETIRNFKQWTVDLILIGSIIRNFAEFFRTDLEKFENFRAFFFSLCPCSIHPIVIIIDRFSSSFLHISLVTTYIIDYSILILISFSSTCPSIYLSSIYLQCPSYSSVWAQRKWS